MIIDSLDNTIQIKIVYFGPAMSGKTTSLKALFNHFGKKNEVASSNFEASMKFIDFLVSDEVQEIFSEFGKDKFGKPLFNPYVKLLKSESNKEMVQWIQELAYFDGEECPQKYRYQAEEFYQMISTFNFVKIRLANQQTQ